MRAEECGQMGYLLGPDPKASSPSTRRGVVGDGPALVCVIQSVNSSGLWASDSRRAATQEVPEGTNWVYASGFCHVQIRTRNPWTTTPSGSPRHLWSDRPSPQR